MVGVEGFQRLLNGVVEQVSKGEDVVKITKARIIIWYGHEQRRGDNSVLGRITRWRSV